MQAGDVEKIVNAYGTVLAEPSALGVVRDARSLPYSKSEIKKALLVAPGVPVNSPLREQLRAGYISLGDFQRLSDRRFALFSSGIELFPRTSRPPIPS